MDTKIIFREASKKLLADFNISAQFNHQGLTGTYREDSLKKFLADGRLPEKYGIGSGEIVGPTNEVSRQSDLVIYDRHNCPVLIYGDSVKVFPSEAVYGIIEVKSKLSKPKLMEGLKNIADFKQTVPTGYVTKKNALMDVTYEKPRPFGMIFAYSLADNSLKSLLDNLTDYEQNNDPDLWPNMIVVLHEGIIWHSKEKGKIVTRTEDLYDSVYRAYDSFKQDTLFEFYLRLFDLLQGMHIGDIDLSKYRDLPKRVGIHFVSGHDGFIDMKSKTLSALSEEFINRVYSHCQDVGTLKYGQVLMLELGEIPEGISKNDLNTLVFYYDPDNLPGIHEAMFSVERDDEGVSITNYQERRLPRHVITIDGDPYIIPQAYIKDKDLIVVRELADDEL